ncbi:MAG TPA: O-antigen ligase family protein [Galbitalea sp.]
MVRKHVWLSVYAVIVFFTVLSGDTERYALTWFGWGAIILGIFVVALVIVIRARDRWRFRDLPFPMLAFLALTVLSVIWSDYRQYTAAAALLSIVTAVGALSLAVSFTLTQLLRLLGHALRIILAASILFELVVAVIVRHPFTPWWTDYGTQKIHPAEYWSRDLLLKGDRIQGIMGNSDLLGFVALLGVIVFAIEFASRSMNRGWSGFWIVVALTDIALTRSATVIVAAVVVVVAAVILVLLRRAATPRGRRTVGIVSIVVVVVGIIGVLVLHAPLLKLLNKSSTLTGRTDIWGEVIKLASERPVVGWGWISYWVPGLKPFDQKVFRIGGIQYLQAHDAWLDLWLQLGIIGVIVFAAFALSALVRAWILAVDRPQLSAGTAGRFDPATLLPVLLLVALLAQSFAESRLLIEYGLLLLALFAIKTKRPDPIAAD